MPTSHYYRNNRRSGNSWSDRDDRERERENYGNRYDQSRYGSDRQEREASANRNYSRKSYNRNYSGNDDAKRQYTNPYQQEGDRNFFERAGDRIRDTWNRWTDDRDDRNRRASHERRGSHRNYFGFPGKPYEYDERNEGYAGRNSLDYSNDYYGDTYYYSPNDERYANNRYTYRGGDQDSYYRDYENYPSYEQDRWYGRDYEDSYVDSLDAHGRSGVDNEDTTDQFYPRERPRRRELVENGW